MKLVQFAPVDVPTSGANLLSALSVTDKMIMRSLFIRPVGADIYLVGKSSDAAADSAVPVLDGTTYEVENVGNGTLWAKTLSGTSSVKLTGNCDSGGR